MNVVLDWTTVLLGVLSLVCAVLGWLARELWDAVKELRRGVTELEVRITRDYITYDRLDRALQPVLEALSEIRNTLSQKVDKP